MFKDDRVIQMQHNNSLINADECEEDDNHAGRTEGNFDIPKCIFFFADNTIVQNYCWLLKFYKTNSLATNHYRIRMLQRICDVAYVGTNALPTILYIL